MGRGRRGTDRAGSNIAPERRGPGRPREWSEERVEQELRTVLAGARTMPSLRQLARMGRSDLPRQITAHGGVRFWAERLGLELGPGQDRRPYGSREAVAEIRQLLHSLGYLPGAIAVRELGYPRLATYLAHNGGSRAVCARLRTEIFG